MPTEGAMPMPEQRMPLPERMPEPVMPIPPPMRQPMPMPQQHTQHMTRESPRQRNAMREAKRRAQRNERANFLRNTAASPEAALAARPEPSAPVPLADRPPQWQGFTAMLHGRPKVVNEKLVGSRSIVYEK